MTEQSKTLRQVLDADCCTGCGLCASAFGENKIEMQMIDPGYLRPTQLGGLSEDEEARFTELCPGIQLEQSSGEGVDHPIWGPIIKVRVGASTDAELRQTASSGGALSGLLCFLLDRGDAEYVVQTAASDAVPIENQTVESTTREQILKAAGSRYSPAGPLSKLSEKLAGGKRFILVGKPCDIAATRAFSKHDERVDETIPYLLSFFCAGVPSLYGTRQILSKLDVNEDDLASFRYRGDGWPGFATAVTKDGKISKMNYADSWGDILSHHTQFRCKVCPDGTGGFADVACADAWDCDENGYPVFEERDGRSLIVTRTRRGEELVLDAISMGYLEATEIGVEEIGNMQPSQANRKRLVLPRILAMRIFTGFWPDFSGLNLREATSGASVLLVIRNFLGMTRRLVRRKLSKA